ncbi:MAG: DUF1592 domain-containing protein [Myxococcota bacterium]
MSTLITLLLACSGPDEGYDAGPEPAVTAPEPALRRLTIRQYQNTVRDLFGEDIVPPSSLEPDATLEGLPSLGAAISSTSPLGVERYEVGAIQLADQRFAGAVDPLPCQPSGVSDTACATAYIEAEGRRIFRRPLSEEEIGQYVGLLTSVASDAADFRAGARFALVAMLQSPAFVYRSEHAAGTLDPFELASRMSYFLWNGPPDEALLAAAEAGELATAEGRSAQVDRMMDDPRFRRGVRDYFIELFQLGGLASLGKDPMVFPNASPELWASAKEQTLYGIEDLVVDRDADYRELMTSRDVWIDRRLAALYGIPAPTLDGFAWATLPEDSGRRGLLGHASVLGLHAHAVSSSATRRGKFMRGTLLCQIVPPPPADVDTSIPEPDDAPTLRDRLQVHQEDPTCAGCHIILDSVGLGLENFDGVGRWRDRENDFPIDPSGVLDGQEFADAVELGAAIASHDNFGPCFADRLASYAIGHLPTDGEEEWIHWLADDFVGNGFHVKRLMRQIAVSDAFAKGGAR